jgi:hypothetical protein
MLPLSFTGRHWIGRKGGAILRAYKQIVLV